MKKKEKIIASRRHYRAARSRLLSHNTRRHNTRFAGNAEIIIKIRSALSGEGSTDVFSRALRGERGSSAGPPRCPPPSQPRESSETVRESVQFTRVLVAISDRLSVSRLARERGEKRPAAGGRFLPARWFNGRGRTRDVTHRAPFGNPQEKPVSLADPPMDGRTEEKERRSVASNGRALHRPQCKRRAPRLRPPC